MTILKWALIFDGILFIWVAGFVAGYLLLRTADDPLSVDRLSQWPEDDDEPVYELPGWDMPGRRKNGR